MTADSINLERVHALVVGIEKYQGGSDLNGPAQDALNFANWLLERGVKPDHVYLFLSPINLEVLEEARARGLNPIAAERDHIDSVICDKLISKNNGGELLHVFWAGHGFITKTGATTRHLLYADTSHNNKWNLNFNSLQEALSTFARGSGFQQQYFWIDACAHKHYQGLYETLGAEQAASKFSCNGEQRQAEQFVLFAAALYEVATNEADLGEGRFSRVLLEELQRKPLSPPEMKVLAEKIQSIFRERQQLEPVYFWSKGSGYDEELLFKQNDKVENQLRDPALLMKLEYKQKNLANLESQVPRLEQQIKAVLPHDIFTKEALEQQLFLLFEKIAQDKQDIQELAQKNG
jgi:hypothetical protein